MKYKVGNRVKAIGGRPKGHCGIIRKINGNEYTVEFDNWHNGHSGTTNGLNIKNSSGWCLLEEEIKLLHKGSKAIKAKPTLYVVIYDEVNKDPAETFSSKAELNKWLKEAKENRDIVWNSIKVYEVKKEFTVKAMTSFRLNKVK